MYSVTVFLGAADMEFDWADLPFEWEGLTSKDVEESFEDPFSCKFLPDSPRFSEQSRYFNLGMSTSGYGISEGLDKLWKLAGRIQRKSGTERSPGTNRKSGNRKICSKHNSGELPEQAKSPYDGN